MSTAAIATLPTVKLALPTGLVNDKTKEGWELLEDAPFTGNEELEFVPFLREGEHSVNGSVMFDRAVELGNRAGQRHAERLFLQAATIPEELRKFYLIFLGTKWQFSGGGLFVPYLYRRGDRWNLSRLSLSRDFWPGIVRLVRWK